MGWVRITRGDTVVIDRVARIGGAAVSLAGAQLWFTAKRSIADQDVDAVIAKSTGAGTIVVVSEPAGTFRITLTAVETALLEPGTLTYDVQLRQASGDVTTIERGSVVVAADVTRAS